MKLSYPCLEQSFPGGSAVKNPHANAGASQNSGSIPGSERSPGGGNGNLLQYPCLENSMDRGAWQATVHGVTKNQTWLSDFHFMGTLRLSLVHQTNIEHLDFLSLNVVASRKGKGLKSWTFNCRFGCLSLKSYEVLFHLFWSIVTGYINI